MKLKSQTEIFCLAFIVAALHFVFSGLLLLIA